MQFRYEYAFLSNFHEAPFEGPSGVQYPTAEHAFQMAKTLDPAQKLWVLEARSPKQAKLRGKSVQLRDDWHTKSEMTWMTLGKVKTPLKVQVMLMVVWLKFSQNKALANKLLATGSMVLEEGNYWKDSYWGVDLNTGKGQNWLGKCLMEVRAKLQQG